MCLRVKPLAPNAHSAMGPRRLGATFSASPAQVHRHEFMLYATLLFIATLACMKHHT